MAGEAGPLIAVGRGLHSLFVYLFFFSAVVFETSAFGVSCSLCPGVSHLGLTFLLTHLARCWGHGLRVEPATNLL